ncbi:MAG: WbqC-like family protein [Bacteroidetes bacterium]|nr:WbqC-like family protein [Bacteroidota bacterium]
MKKVFISQSNYIPWRGYFHAISSVDEFIVYDEVQYTRRDWRNRNRIKTPGGDLWLSIPIEVKNKFHQKISEARISDSSWARNHWKTLQTNYSKSPWFKMYSPLFEALYLEKKYTHLTEVNYDFLGLICFILKIKTTITYSLDVPLPSGNRSERLLSLCKKAGATDYYSGPAAKNYLDEGIFRKQDVNVHYFDYSAYKPYPQMHGAFSRELSVLDLIFNIGPDAVQYLLPGHAEPALLHLPELILS